MRVDAGTAPADKIGPQWAEHDRSEMTSRRLMTAADRRAPLTRVSRTAFAGRLGYRV
jgi:hypothetical protein